jgi:glycine cleavage system transcriptional repressor
MTRSFVLTLTGADRVGIVDALTRLLLDHGGNVETSRMARLGGEFAVLMLVAMPAERFDRLSQALESLIAQGYKVTTTPTEPSHAGAHAGGLPYQIEVEGADHEGIIHGVAHYLSERGINIESVDTETTSAALSGSPLFTMTARVMVPPDPASEGWEQGLADIAHRENLEITVTRAARS